MKFESDYYHGQDSNYRDYTEKKFEGLAQDLIESLTLGSGTRIIDFGCATGGLLRSLMDRGVTSITGTDVSYWAIKYGREAYKLPPQVLQHYNRQLLEERCDYLLALDVLEHIPTDELNEILSCIQAAHIVVRIPVSHNEGEPFVLEVSRNDKTHIQIHCKEWWNGLLVRYGYANEFFFSRKNIYESDGVLARVYKKQTQ